MRARPLLVSALLFASSCREQTESLPCDIRERACQKAVFRATARARGQYSADMPRVRLISRARLEEEYRQGFDQQEADPALERWTNALRLLELLPKAQSFDDAFVDSAVANVAAYYSPGNKSITIVEDSATSEEDGTFYLSHEFVHALQDQREGLLELQEAAIDTTDATVAIDSLTEGEAIWLSNLVVLRADGVSEYEIDFEGYFDELLESTLEGVSESDAPLIEATTGLPYPVGGKAVSRRHLAAGPLSVARLYDGAPETLAAWLDAPVAGLPRPLACETPPPPVGYEWVESDRMGIAGIIALWTRLDDSGSDAFLDAQPWTADSLSLYAPVEDGTEQVALAWRIRLRSTSQAELLAESVERHLKHVEVLVENREVLLTAASDVTALAAWTDKAECPAIDKSRRERGESTLARRRRLLEQHPHHRFRAPQRHYGRRVRD